MQTETKSKYRMIAVRPEVYEEIRKLSFDKRTSILNIIERAIGCLQKELLEDELRKGGE